jgi:hypothetical protein
VAGLFLRRAQVPRQRDELKGVIAPPPMNPKSPNHHKEYVSADMQRLLRSATQQPWGPGRELESRINALHQESLVLESRLGTPFEKPADLERSRKVSHELRNKLMIFLYYEEKRQRSADVA